MLRSFNEGLPSFLIIEIVSGVKIRGLNNCGDNSRYSVTMATIILK